MSLTARKALGNGRNRYIRMQVIQVQHTCRSCRSYSYMSMHGITSTGPDHTYDGEDHAWKGTDHTCKDMHRSYAQIIPGKAQIMQTYHTVYRSYTKIIHKVISMQQIGKDVVNTQVQVHRHRPSRYIDIDHPGTGRVTL